MDEQGDPLRVRSEAIALMDAQQTAIWEIYQQVDAPDWVSVNLDGLVDVMRDLAWLPEGPLTLRIPDLSGLDASARSHFLNVLWMINIETNDGPRPVRWVFGDGD